MSGTPANLNKARKEHTRAASRKNADANALKFGRSKAQKQADTAALLKAQKQVDDHKRDPE
ncbi:MAG: DUF4169 family protein [Boseongicola sp.]|nr:MAG: DUF4169 family protein [Boseongicola sp.]